MSRETTPNYRGIKMIVAANSAERVAKSRKCSHFRNVAIMFVHIDAHNILARFVSNTYYIANFVGLTSLEDRRNVIIRAGRRTPPRSGAGFAARPYNPNRSFGA